MKYIGTLILVMLLGTTLQARDTKLMLSVSKGLKKGRQVGALDRSIRVQFGSSGLRSGQRRYTANRKTNAFNKTDVEACEWAFISSVKSLQDRARNMGKRRVTGIVNYYNRRRRSNPSRYECHVGKFVAKVAIQGNI